MTDEEIALVLRYIGDKKGKCDDKLKERIIQYYEQVENVANPKFLYHLFTITKDKDEIQFQGTNMKIKSNQLAKVLKDANRCFILAGTMGMQIDRWITKVEQISMLDALILDACTSVKIEMECNKLQARLEQTLHHGEYFTMRYSPGYGDVSIMLGTQIVEILHADKYIGMTCTKQGMLIPRKSITAFLGITNHPWHKKEKCAYCSQKYTCPYRQESGKCDKG